MDPGPWTLIIDFGSWTYFDHSQVQGEKAPVEGEMRECGLRVTVEVF